MPVYCASDTEGRIIFHNQSTHGVPKRIFNKTLRCLDISCGRTVYIRKSVCGTKVELYHANTKSWCPKQIKRIADNHERVRTVFSRLSDITKRLRSPTTECNLCSRTTTYENDWSTPYLWISKLSLFICNNSRKVVIRVLLRGSTPKPTCVFPDFIDRTVVPLVITLEKLYWYITHHLREIIYSTLCNVSISCPSYNCIYHPITIRKPKFMFHKLCLKCGVFYRAFNLADLFSVQIPASCRLELPLKLKSAAFWTHPASKSLIGISEDPVSESSFQWLVSKTSASRVHFSRVHQRELHKKTWLFSETPDCTGLCDRCSETIGETTPICVLCNKNSVVHICSTCQQTTGLYVSKGLMLYKHSCFVHIKSSTLSDTVWCDFCETHVNSLKVCRKPCNHLWPSNSDAASANVHICIDCVSFCIDCKEPVFWLEPTGCCWQCAQSRLRAAKSTHLLATQQHTRLTILPGDVIL